MGELCIKIKGWVCFAALFAREVRSCLFLYGACYTQVGKTFFKKEIGSGRFSDKVAVGKIEPNLSSLEVFNQNILDGQRGGVCQGNHDNMAKKEIRRITGAAQSFKSSIFSAALCLRLEKFQPKIKILLILRQNYKSW